MEKKIERAARHCGVSELSKSSMNATNETVVTKRLAHFFRTSLALSKFSTAFAMSWVKEHAADESCQRVMAYLLARMNDRRTKCKDTWRTSFAIDEKRNDDTIITHTLLQKEDVLKSFPVYELLTFGIPINSSGSRN